ncbi:Ig-like domain-containing protein [Mycolicibacterium sp. XJ662]
MAGHALLTDAAATRDARYVGRVGALAVALGIGAAIAGIPGVAGAAPDTEASTTETSDATTTGSDVEAGETLDSDAPQNGTQTAPSDSSSGQGDEASDPSTVAPDPRDGTVQATGGLNTTVNGDSDGDAADEDAAHEDAEDTQDSDTDGDTGADATPTKSSDAATGFSDTRIQTLVMKYTGGVARGGSGNTSDSTAQEVTDEGPVAQVAHTWKALTATPDTAAAPEVPEPLEDVATISTVLPSPVAPVTPAQAPLLLLSALSWMRRTLFNTTPNALNDAVVTEVNTVSVIDVLANDEDEEGNSIRVTGFTQPENGTVTLSADGTFTYVPDEGFNGVDTFTYSVADRGFNIFRDPLRMLTGQGPRTDTATVSLYVGDVGIEPPSKWAMNIHMRQPVGASAISPDGTRLYVARGEGGSDTIGVIDTATNREVAAITGLRDASGMVFSPDGKRLYVANTFALKRYVSVIDTATNKEIATIEEGVFPSGSMAISADGTRLYVSNAARNNVNVIDTSTNKVTGNIAVNGSVYFNPDHTRLYVVGRSTVSILDPATHAVTSTFDMPPRFTNIAFSPDGTRIYVGNQHHDVVALDAVTGKVLGAVNTGGPPAAVAASPDGKRVYATSSNFRGIKPKLTVIDTATFKAVTTIPMDWYPVALSITPDSKKVYVSISKDKRVTMIA